MTELTCDNIGGNAYDKYHTKNPVARWLMRGFLNAFDTVLDRARASTAFEIGCGEGHLAAHMEARGIICRGCDLDQAIVGDANRSSRARGDGDRFVVKSVYDLAPGEISADVIVCCEVLEHVPDPTAALRSIAAQNAQHFIFSVPREPVWRALNVCRGKYLGDLGNTPGHIQHWSASAIQSLVGRHFEIVDVRTPLPWTMMLCRAKA